MNPPKKFNYVVRGLLLGTSLFVLIKRLMPHSLTILISFSSLLPNSNKFHYLLSITAHLNIISLRAPRAQPKQVAGDFSYHIWICAWLCGLQVSKKIDPAWLFLRCGSPLGLSRGHSRSKYLETSPTPHASTGRPSKRGKTSWTSPHLFPWWFITVQCGLFW